MAVGLLQTVTLIVSTCSKHVSRAARKLRQQGNASLSRLSTAGVFSRRSNVVPLGGGGGSKRKLTRRPRKRDSNEEEDEEEEAADEMDVEAGEGVWRRTILMGEKCQPLDFSGVIYYDAEGKRLSEVPTPRSPMRSPLHSLAAARSPLAAAGSYDGTGHY